MIRLYTLLRNPSSKKTLHQLIIKHEIRDINVFRALVLTGIFSLISAFQFILRQRNHETVSEARAASIRYLILLNQGVFILSLSLFLVLLWTFRRPYLKNRIGKYIPHLVFFLVTLWGTFVTIFDQQVSSSLTSFILGSIVCSLILLIHPRRMFCYLLLISLILYVGVIQYQSDPMIQLTNLTEAFCTVVVCYGLSITQWRKHLVSFRQRRLIKSQQETLKENYEQLKESSEQLEQLNQSKDKFFAILAHDLRGPISSTLALTEMLDEGLFESDEKERRRMYGLLQNSLNTTGKLLENVLLWSRSHMGTLTFKPVTLNLYELIENNIALLQIMAAHKDIIIRNKVAEQLETEADLDMINTIVRNLLSNAIKFTPNGGQVEVLSAKHTDPRTHQSYISLSVRDYGIGMNSKTMDNLFKIDKKVVNNGTNNETGTGLGLILCQDFIHKHEGQLKVESILGTGTTFTITIPTGQAFDSTKTTTYLCSTL
jgi:two-component system sensor histidine kinase/response regulator